MKQRILAILLGLGLALGFPVSAFADAAIDAATNAVRAEFGKAPLVSSGPLASLAATRAQQISTVWGHPTDWQWMFDAIPGCEAALGENIASYTTGAEPVGWPVSAWRNSPSHFENMLRDWNYQGSALYRAPNGKTYAVQLFAKACSVSPAPPAPAPRPAPPPAGPPIVDEIPDTHM